MTKKTQSYTYKHIALLVCREIAFCNVQEDVPIAPPPQPGDIIPKPKKQKVPKKPKKKTKKKKGPKRNWVGRKLKVSRPADTCLPCGKVAMWQSCHVANLPCGKAYEPVLPLALCKLVSFLSLIMSMASYLKLQRPCRAFLSLQWFFFLSQMCLDLQAGLVLQHLY